MRIQPVQLLRAVAAIVVLAGHAMGTAAAMGPFVRPTLPTGIGVDLFFAISGFIMVYASDRLFARPGAAKEFLARRIQRVAPLYWLATTLVLLMTLIGKGPGGVPSVTYLASSYFFIPDASYGSVDGIAFPLLSLGWTLNYEMLFYALFSLFLFLPRPSAVRWVQVTLVAAVLLGALLRPNWVVLATWTQPIILEFGLGMLIGNAFLSGRRIGLPAAIALLVVAGAWVALDPFGLMHLPQTPNDARRLIGWGLPAAMVLGAAVLRPWALPRRVDQLAGVLGDASYSLYLMHPFVLVAMRHAWLRFVGERGLPVFVVVTVCLAILMSIAVNRRVERPLTRAAGRMGTWAKPRKLQPQPSA